MMLISTRVAQVRLLFSGCLYLVASALFSPASAQTTAPSVLWDRTLGGSRGEALRAMVPTSDGGYLVGGSSSSPVSGDKSQPLYGAADYWVVKVDAQGRKQWDQAYGGPGSNILYSITATADGGYLLAGTSTAPAGGTKSQGNRGDSDYWIVKIDAQGRQQWDRTFGGSLEDRLAEVVASADGGFLLAGYSGSPISGEKSEASRGSVDYWVVKVDAQGSKQWDRTYGANSTDYLTGVHATTDGGYVLGGYTSSGVYGDKTVTTNSGTHAWLVKISATGSKVWDRVVATTAPGMFSSFVFQLRGTADGGSILCGTVGTPYDAWVTKLDADGRQQWDYTVGGPVAEYLHEVQQLADGSYIGAGYGFSGYFSPAQGGIDGILLKLSATGTLQWSRTVGGSGDDQVWAVVPRADGGLVIGASTNSDISGDKTTPSKGNGDYWLLQVGGTPVTATRGPDRLSLKAYPNPAHHSIVVTVPSDAPRNDLMLSLQDMQGRTVHRQPILASGYAPVPVQLGVRPGLYLLCLEGPGGYRSVQRVQVQ